MQLPASTETLTVTLQPRKTAQVKQCAVYGPTLGSFVIQGGPEVELRAPAYKKHVSITHNALSVRAKVL